MRLNVFDPKEKEDAERRKRAAVELADSYRQMMDTYAWRDLSALLEKIIADSNDFVDDIAIQDLALTVVARARGLREAVEIIRKHVLYRTTEGPL